MRILFWQRVQSLLKAHKISQEKFAQLLGMSYNTLRGWLYNNRLPDAQSACDMAKVLGVTVEYLVWGGHKSGIRQKIKPHKEQKIVSEKIKNLVLKLSNEVNGL